MHPRHRVLVVDDDRQIVEGLSIRLKAAGYDVLSAHGGREGVDTAIRTHPDAMLLDMRMPGMGGLAVLSEMRRHQETKRIPVVVLSANVADRAERQALDTRLSQAGFLVLTASTPSDGLELAGDHHVDAIILDVNLHGEIDGLGLAKRLREEVRTACIPVLFVTGAAEDGFRKKCEAVGGTYFITKPYDSELLVRTLQAMLAADEIAELQRIAQAKRRQPQH